MVVTMVLMISLTAVLQQSAGQHPDFASLSTRHSDQREEIIDTHNDFRKNVNPQARNMLKMEWDSTAAKNARRWARKCLFNHSQAYERTVNGKACGENLFMSTVPTSWTEVTQAWGNEKNYFKYGYGSVTGDAVGHYTQVVWYRSFQIGCSVAHCPGSKYTYYSVCHYCPAGNIVGSVNTPYKTGRPCGDCPGNCEDRLCTNPCKHANVYSNCPDLAQSPGCNHLMVKDNCEASCRCPTEIK
ncbi:serotriflin-like [Eublepharis macularius]|uniref:Serotriflin-like n=1 Tax=Eublepharis macularius TaxID=481883 RepID=A0AA97JC70_EUBMA|nr:serotriflin-like [Eublepharis macularius]